MATGFKVATVNASDVPSTQTNFPAYVDLSRLGITTLAEAQSVRVYADASKTTEWAREIVSVTEMHVLVPSLTSTVDIYVDWDGVSADYAVTDTYGRNAVWSDYEAVWHMQEDPSGSAPQIVDSTGNGHNGTSQGSMNSGDSIAGKVGNCIDYDDTNDYIDIANPTGFLINSATISSWAKMNTGKDQFRAFFVGDKDSSANKLTFFASSTGLLAFYQRYSGSNKHTYNVTGTPIDDAWHLNHWHIAASDRSYWVDGVLDTTDTTYTTHMGNILLTDKATLGIMFYNNAWNSATTQVPQDEVRVYIGKLTQNWVTTEYNNQNDEAGFWGTWSDAGGTPSTQGLMMMM